MTTIYTTTGHLAHLRISDRTNLHDARYGVDAAQSMEITKCFELAQTNLASAGKYIRKQMERYPKNPIFQNYMGTWYEKRGERDKSTAQLELTYEQFPDYLFAGVNMANTRIAQERPDDALHYLGSGLRIEERYPERDEFHVNEVQSYESACIKYHIAKKEWEAARERLETLRSLGDDKEWLNQLDDIIMVGLWSKRREDEKAELERMPKMEFEKQPVSAHAERELVLQHEELRVLFSRSMDLAPEEIAGLLALPRESLVRDLCGILQHSIDRFHHYQAKGDELWWDELSFVHHAILLLGELRGQDSLEAVLITLSQSREYLDFYLGEWLTEDIWEPLAKLADGHLSRLDAFMRVPRLNAFSKVVVSEAVNQLGQHRPELLPEVERWYTGLLAFYNAASPEDEVMDATQLGLMVGDILELGLASLQPAVEALYERDIVPIGMCGNIDAVRDQFAEGAVHHKRAMLSLAERYANLSEIEATAQDDEVWEGEEEDDGLDDAPLVRLPITRATPKVGRNDPCTCGSGKKFKKCCEGKATALPAELTQLN